MVRFSNDYACLRYSYWVSLVEKGEEQNLMIASFLFTHSVKRASNLDKWHFLETFKRSEFAKEILLLDGNCLNYDSL